MKKNIVIIGSRGYKYNYGGWETFVTNLVKNTKDKEYQFYIPNLVHEKNLDKTMENIDGVTSFNLYVSPQGFVTMFSFTIKSMNYMLKYIKENHLENTVILMLGCKVGPLLPMWKRKLKKLNVKLIINPDGLEWKREKWAWWIKQCFKISERYSIKYADFCVCDSKAILKYVEEKYENYQTPSSFIAYGAYESKTMKQTELVKKLWKEENIKDNNYYLIVGRFIPENNYETMIKEFMKSKTKRDLVIVCNLEKNKFYQYLEEETHFHNDSRIKFIGSVYDKDSLIYIRQNAYAYFHGHSAGGTNPSLLEALSNTKLNVLYDVSYNKEVGKDSSFYFTKKDGSLKNVIDELEKLKTKDINHYGILAKKRIREDYTWDIVVEKYQSVFENLLKDER